MHLVAFVDDNRPALGLCLGDEVVNLTKLGAPDRLDDVLQGGAQALSGLELLGRTARNRIPVAMISRWLPPVTAPGKAIAVGLNFVDHVAEANTNLPDFPVLFSRYPTSWVGHNDPIELPRVSNRLDYEGELAVIIGKAGRYIERANALNHVAGYSIFNEGSIRDYQFKTHQWTIGKNFDRSGSFGPFFVSADALPAGASGLRLQTKLNGKVMQDANTRDMIFDVARLIEVCSQAFALQPGDIIIAGTPSGVGAAYKPPVFMAAGDICEVSIEGIGVLSNSIVAPQS